MQWTRDMRHTAGYMHRKLWEWSYIAQVLRERELLRPGVRGVGFAVGQEPLAATFAGHGCDIVATDLEPIAAGEQGWVATDQHAASLASLNQRGICPPDEFARRVTFRALDMRALPDGLGPFDFLWSSCAMEHLGSLREGMDFVRGAMRYLKPGGVAVHTTELNCASDTETVETGHDVVYRQRDLRQLAAELGANGHAVSPFDFALGDSDIDRHVDEPPYDQVIHLKVRIGGHVSTSFGFIITAAAARS